MSDQMDDPADALRQAKPGDVLSFQVPEADAPAIGLRMISVILPKEPDGGPTKTSWLGSDHGPWEVVKLEPSPDHIGHIKVSIRLHG
jgi:hypothetical protein